MALVLAPLALGGCPDDAASAVDTGADADVLDVSAADADTGPETADADTGPETADVSPPGPAVVMTYNVLCYFCDPSYDPWEDRLLAFVDVFARHDPDLLGLQELVAEDDLMDVVALLPDHDVVWFDGPGNGILDTYADATIFYRRADFELVEQGHYWLSATPDQPWSGGWANGNLWRLVVWAHLRRLADGSDLYVASTHFDNNTPNQENSAPLTVERTAPWADTMPVIVMGDFNSKPGSEAYGTLDEAMDDAFDLAETWSASNKEGESLAYDDSGRIDHVWVGGPVTWTVPWWTVDLSTYGDHGLRPSDHDPIVVELSW